MTDICSIWAYEEIKQSGYLGARQAMFLSVFVESSKPLTAKEANDLVGKKFGIDTDGYKYDARRLSELEAMGFIRKADHVKCFFTGNTVNRWRYSGRTQPYPQEKATVFCPHCNGRGVVVVDRYVPDDDQLTLPF